ncbi:unnamed protein product [Ranitomeya imitator]|uniref:Uncharacterized protein n=1 Tax=Ranitomeya imitator TaxID=111125 RepID=A0ABN9LH71_9NEOB|nr:unnamed protein product [Ranitomeya imitator]
MSQINRAQRLAGSDEEEAAAGVQGEEPMQEESPPRNPRTDRWTCRATVQPPEQQAFALPEEVLARNEDYPEAARCVSLGRVLIAAMGSAARSGEPPASSSSLTHDRFGSLSGW